MRKDALRSIRSCSRARTSSERGFALVAAVFLVVLYVALIELLLIDSSRELNEARRFRARVIAATLAENGAELAAANIVNRPSANVNAEDSQGTITGTMRKTPGQTSDHIVIVGKGTTIGLVETSARVELTGTIYGNRVTIDFAQHTP